MDEGEKSRWHFACWQGEAAEAGGIDEGGEPGERPLKAKVRGKEKAITPVSKQGSHEFEGVPFH